MKKITLNIIISLLLVSCINDKSKITLIDCNNVDGKPEYMLFKSENEGYMFNYKGNLYSDANIMIYKTINGGTSWQKIYSAKDWLFYGYAKLYNNAIFGNVKSSKDLAKNKLFKLDLATNEFKLLDFNIEAIGNIWIKNDSILLSFGNKSQNCVLSTDTNFLNYYVKPFAPVPKNNGVVYDGVNTFLITHQNTFIIDKNNAFKDIGINSAECIVTLGKNRVLITTQEQENSINMYQFDGTSDKLEKLQTIENYSIISHLQSNENVIVAFVGNIEGMFVSYDLTYSTDKGQTWQILKLKEKNLISPNCLVDNVLYIYSGRKLQKIIF